MKLITLIFLVIIVTGFILPADFISEQAKYQRVRSALDEKGELISEKLKSNHLDKNKLNILFVAFKNEAILDIYSKNNTESKYKILSSYEICSRSGNLGPKRKSGDNQVPEGFYFIDRFNPTSDYYLSLGINYPNTSDKIKSRATNLGGDIFIHGDCVTIGCLPMTDDKIKEIYLLAVYAKNGGQNKIPVYSYPFKMTDSNFENFKINYKNETALIKFWTNLKVGYDKFYSDKKELLVKVDATGSYIF